MKCVELDELGLVQFMYNKTMEYEFMRYGIL